MINTSGWDEFTIGNLFEIIRPVARSSQKYKKGNVPFVASGNFNNGITDYLEPIDENDFDDGNCITVSAVDGYAFYQKENFLGRGGAGSSIMILKNDNLNEWNGLFLCTLIRVACSNWDYANMGNKDKLADTVVCLPVESHGKPDWAYMESYMKQIMDDSEKELENLKKANDEKHLIDTSGWKEFRVTEFFDISLPQGDLQVKKVTDGEIPLITPSNFNNGLLKLISRDSQSTLYKKGSLTVDMFGNAYYQEKDFFVTAHGHVNVLLPKMQLNVYTGTFLASTIRAMFFDKYEFNEMCTKKVLSSESIKLPVTLSCEPDWAYMESFMKQKMADAEKTVSVLHSHMANATL